MSIGRIIVGIGEALFDIFGEEARLGGAPLNVAVHAQQLGNAGTVVSRVGQDELGRRVCQELQSRDMTTAFVQSDPDHPTGTVYVQVSEAGEPTYEITPNVAWDALQFDPDMEPLARRADAICFGTLAQREGQTRNTIYRFLEAAPQAVRLLDVNLRQSFYDRRMLVRSMELASAVKLNTAELRMLDDLLDLGGSFDSAAQKLRKQFELDFIALTRGAEGTVVYTADERYAGEPVSVDVVDAVGAGDAATAALLHGATRRWAWPRTVALANRLGAHVAGSAGACPALTPEILTLAGQAE